MTDPEKVRARCEAHDMAYDPAVHSGCIVCRREEAEGLEEQDPGKPRWPIVVAITFVTIAASGIAIGVFGYQKHQQTLEADGPTEPVVGAIGGTLPEDEGYSVMLGREGVNDAGSPKDLPDKLALLNLLRKKRYRLLNTSIEGLQDEADADLRKEHWPSTALEAFASPDRRLGQRLDAWVRATPGSFAPHLARAKHRIGLAFHYRGGKWAHLPSKKRMAKMAKLLGRAETDIKRALSKRPNLPGAASMRLWIAAGVGADLATRDAILEQALEECPYCYGVRADYIVSVSPRWGGTYELMQEKAERWQFVKHNPGLARLLSLTDYERCVRLLLAEEYEEAVGMCARSLDTGPIAGAYLSQAKALALLERYDEAVEAYTRALEIAPQSLEGLEGRGAVLLRLERYDQAAKDLALVLRLDPTNRSAENNLDHILKKLVLMAYYQAEAGEVDAAIANFDRVLDMHPRYADAFAYRGYAYLKKDDVVQAEKDLLTAIKLDPRNLQAYRGLDATLFRQKRLDEIIAHWNRYLKRKPKDAEALLERSGTYYHKGEMELALRDVRAACKLGNEDACATQRRFAPSR
ncbi:MAG: tetratricopeptide repeat protein [Myxococcota bacterium]